MGATRKISYASTSQAGVQHVFSGAETWGELKKENAGIEAASLNMKPWIKGEGPNAGVGITSDTQKLPEDDFTMYFLISKNDSGI